MIRMQSAADAASSTKAPEGGSKGRSTDSSVQTTQNPTIDELNATGKATAPTTSESSSGALKVAIQRPTSAFQAENCIGENERAPDFEDMASVAACDKILDRTEAGLMEDTACRDENSGPGKPQEESEESESENQEDDMLVII